MGSIRILPKSSSILFSSSFILLIFLVPSFLSDDDERFSRCAPSTCGNINIHYPFWVDVQSEYCGYPGYKLSCNDSTTEIEMMWKQYLVKDINYDDQMLRIVDKDFMDEECPQPSTDTTINSTLFVYSSGDLNLTLYYNCPSSIPTYNYPLYSLPCLTKNNNYAFFTFQPFPPYNDLRNCHISNISLIGTAKPRLEDNPHIFGVVLKEGFEVEWTTQSWWCIGCMETNGRCGFNTTTLQYICLCRDQPRIGNCSGPVPVIRPGMYFKGSARICAWFRLLVCGKSHIHLLSPWRDAIMMKTVHGTPWIVNENISIVRVAFVCGDQDQWFFRPPRGAH